MNSPFRTLPKSFVSRIIVILIVTMICMAAIFNGILFNMQKKSYQAALNAHGQSLVRILAHTVNMAVISEDLEQLLIPVKGVLLQNDVVEVTVWNQDGTMLLQKNKNPNGSFDINTQSKDTETILRNLATNSQLTTETEERFIYWSQVTIDFWTTPQENLYFQENRSDSKKEIVGYLAISISKKFYKAGVRNILIQTGVTILIYLCFTILTTFFIIHKATEPLRKLMLVIRKKRQNQTASDDMSVLTATYDSMLEDLEKSFVTINQLNEGLEEKVNYRTKLLIQANEELVTKKRNLEKSNRSLTKALDQLKDTQDQLIQKEKLAAMGQLVAGVAHEINNTINFVSGALPSLHRSLDDLKEVLCSYEEIEKDCGSKALEEKIAQVKALKAARSYDEIFNDIDQLMENIDEGTRRTTHIIRDLKTFSREDAETIIALDLHVLIDSTIKLLDKKLLKNISIYHTYGTIPPVYCLPGRLGQVFLNIMHNALQAMDETGDLTIATQYQNEHVHIVFSDTGCGIPTSDLAKIFDPFFTSKEVGKGTGLGLGISYAIVRQHGGVINVQSKMGEGTMFEVVLPVDFRAVPQSI